MKIIRKFANDQSGAVALEYALIAILVSLAGLKSVHCITVYCIAPVFADLAAFFQSAAS